MMTEKPPYPSESGRTPSPEERAENALVEWFHGSDKHPYTAPGHAEDATNCWHCGEAATVVAALMTPARTPAAKDQQR